MISDVSAENARFQISVVSEFDVEAALKVDLISQAEDQVDIKDDANAEPWKAKTDRRVRSEQVDCVGSASRHGNFHVHISFNAVELEADSGIDDILIRQFGNDSALCVTVDASDCERDALHIPGATRVNPGSERQMSAPPDGPAGIPRVLPSEEDLVLPGLVHMEVCRESLLQMRLAGQL